jgi:hypothetical protein
VERWDILRTLIERGSDELARDLYDRLCADRVARPGAKHASGERILAPTWQDLAAQALKERTLTPDEALPLVQDAVARDRVAGSVASPMGVHRENRAG